MRRPGAYSLPDLSALDSHLVANYIESVTVGRAFPPGQAQHLATALMRTTESALRRYEGARLLLVDAAARDSFIGYLEGCTELEVAVMTLDRAMRVADALVACDETLVSKSQIPSKSDRDKLRKVRNAIDHLDGSLKDGQGGIGKSLHLAVGADESTIDDDTASYVVPHTDLGGWVAALHALAVELTNNPSRYARAPAQS